MSERRKLSEAWASTIAVIAALVAGLLLFNAWSRLPLPRDGLTAVDHAGPLLVDTPLVRYGVIGARQKSGTYRRQEVRLTAGPLPGVYRPPKFLWVDDIDQAGSGQTLRFLVDPREHLIYEVRMNGRLLLAYDRAVEQLSSEAQDVALFGAGFLAIAFWMGGPVLWRRRGSMRLSL